MKPATPTNALQTNQRRCRIAILALLPAGLLILRLVRPESVPRWWPLPTSCGAVTGLPCIFCGTTRALHYLLNGDFGRALYFNWLAFPILAGALALIVLSAIELRRDRDLLARVPRPHLTSRSLGGCAVALVLLWLLQVYLAVSEHKTELLNPDGPLYKLVVR